MSTILLLAACLLLAAPAWGADALNVYTAWPESLSQPIFKAYTARTGVAVNFIRLSTGELVARATAEKNNPRADVIWGAPGDGFAGAKEKGLKPPTSWNDLLDPAYKGQIQTADARTSGTALTRILSIYYAFGRDEDKAVEYQKRLHQNVQVYTKSGGGCTIPTAMGQAMVCIAHMPDAMEAKKKGYDMITTFPREGVAAVIEAVALVRGAKNREAATRFIDWTFTKDMQDLLDKNEVYMLPTLPGGSINPAVAALMKEAKLLPVDLDWVGKNRKRLVDRWVNEVIKE